VSHKNKCYRWNCLPSVVLFGVGRDVAETGGLGADSLGQPPVLSKGLDIFGRGSVGQVMIATHQGGGKVASSLSIWMGIQNREGIGWGKGRLCRGPVHGMVRLVARVRWIGCRRWEGCPEASDSLVLVIG